MKNFDKPTCEVVKFDRSVIATSDSCGCFDELMGPLEGDCLGDVSYCECQVNYSSALANCIPCPEYQA